MTIAAMDENTAVCTGNKYLVYNEKSKRERYDSQGSHHHRQKAQSSPFVNPFFGSVLSDQR